MSDRKILILVFIIGLVQFRLARNCVYFDNTRIALTETHIDNHNTTNLEIMSYYREGWVSIGFSPDKNPYNAISVLIFLPNHTFITYQHGKLYPNSTLSNVEHSYTYREQFEELITVNFDIDSQLIHNHSYVMMARAMGPIPTSFSTVGNHTFTMIKQIDIFHNQRTCYALSGWRVEFMHLSVYIPMLIASLTILILLFLFRNHQPLKSRGLGPYILALTYIALMTMYFVLVEFSWEWKNNWGCYVLLFDSILIELTYIVPILMFLKYLFVINLNSYKDRFYEEFVESGKMKMDFKFLIISKIVTWPFVLLLLFGYFVISLGMSTAVLAMNKFQCFAPNEDVYEYAIYSHMAFTILACFILFLLQVYDVIKNPRECLKCNWIQFLTTNDPFSFRLEMITLPFTGIVYSAYIVTLYQFKDEEGNFLDVLFKLILLHYFIVVQIFLPLILTMWKWFRQKCGKNSTEKNPLDKILKDPIIFEMFSQFARLEWNQENIFCKLDIMRYKSQKSNRKQISKDILDMYLEDGACFSLTLNMNHLTIPTILKTRRSILKGEYFDLLFDDLERELDRNLTEMIVRFEKYPEYEKYAKFKEFKDVFLEKDNKERQLLLNK